MTAGPAAAGADLRALGGRVLVVGAADAPLQLSSGTALLLAPGELHDCTQQAGTWDALRLWRCAGLFDELTLFADLARLLRPAPARLQVVDRFALQRRARDLPGTQLLQDFIALAQRLGWEVLDRQLSPDGADHVQAALLFERREPPIHELRRIDEASLPALQALFEHVFGHPLSHAHWQWKYGQGRGVGLGLWTEGRLVAHFAGLSRRVLLQGQATRACQICDVMVRADANRSIVRQGPMHKVSATFIETEVGYARTHRFGFGFPTVRHHRLAEKLGLYCEVDQLVAVRWPALDGAAPSLRWLDEAAAWKAALGALQRAWREMALAMGDAVLGMRDVEWLDYRYRRHPAKRYRLALFFADGDPGPASQPLGAVVLREDEAVIELVDLVAAPLHFDAAVMAVRLHAARCGRAFVDLWITRSQLPRLAHCGWSAATVHDLHITIPANVHTTGVPPDVLRDRWFLLAGDTDFR